MLFDHSNTKLFLALVMFHPQSSHLKIAKKGGKKKDKVHEEDSDVEVFPRIEIIYEDMKLVTGVEPDFKWGQIYHKIKDQSILMRT